MLRRLSTILACIVVFLSVQGCEPESSGTEEGATTTAAGAEFDDPLATAVTVAQAVRENPDTAEQVLSEHGMTVEQFEALMYQIAADPELSAEFEAAME